MEPEIKKLISTIDVCVFLQRPVASVLCGVDRSITIAAYSRGSYTGGYEHVRSFMGSAVGVSKALFVPKIIGSQSNDVK